MPDYVFDTTVLPNFAAVKQLDLLVDQYRGQAFTTFEVSDELRRGFHAGYLFLEDVRQYTFVTDDLAARRLAQSRNVALTGTVGILLTLVREQALPLSEANAILTNMIQRRYHSPIDRLDDLI